MPAFASGGTAEWEPVTIRVWDSATTGVAPPPPEWDWHANRYQSDDVIVTYDRQRRRLTLVDTTTRSATYWIASSSSWPPWSTRRPSATCSTVFSRRQVTPFSTPARSATTR